MQLSAACSSLRMLCHCWLLLNSIRRSKTVVTCFASILQLWKEHLGKSGVRGVQVLTVAITTHTPLVAELKCYEWRGHVWPLRRVKTWLEKLYDKGPWTRGQWSQLASPRRERLRKRGWTPPHIQLRILVRNPHSQPLSPWPEPTKEHGAWAVADTFIIK